MGKNFKVQKMRTGVNFEIYNLFNTNAVLTENATYRDATHLGLADSDVDCAAAIHEVQPAARFLGVFHEHGVRTRLQYCALFCCLCSAVVAGQAQEPCAGDGVDRPTSSPPPRSSTGTGISSSLPSGS